MAAQREWFDVDYYQVLGVSKTATEKEITKAYRKLAKKFHPDANPGDKSAEDRFKEISAAYDVLGDVNKRKEYDQVREMGASGFGQYGASGGNPFGFGAAGGQQNIRFEDLGDIFGGLFGGGSRGSTNSSARNHRHARRGSDIETSIQLNFEDALSGLTTKVPVKSEATCDICNGSGAEPGTNVKRCPMCSGTGEVSENQGPFSFARPCGNCQGSGRVVEKPCKKCKGRGHYKRAREVTIRIAAGAKDGSRIKVAGRGEPGVYGGPAGDLYVRIKVLNHKLFGRKGNDLTIKVPVTYPELALGAEISVPTLGQPIKLKIPSGTSAGAILRAKGKGSSKLDSNSDLLVTLELDSTVPKSGREKQLIEELKEITDKKNVRGKLLKG